MAHSCIDAGGALRLEEDEGGGLGGGAGGREAPLRAAPLHSLGGFSNAITTLCLKAPEPQM